MTERIGNTKVEKIFSQENYPFGNIIHLYGGAGSGKTSFCLNIAFLLAKNGFKTLYIDTEGHYAVDRLKQISANDFEKVSSLILFSIPRNFNEQNKTIDNLSNFITKDVKLIVVDSIISHYRSELAKKKQGITLNKQLNQQVAQLKDLAMKKNIMVLVVNQVRADMNSPESQGIPLSKRVFDHWSDIEVQFVIHPENKIIRVSFLNKHPIKSNQDSKCQFKIVNEGII